MKDIRLRIEQIDSSTTQAYKDLKAEFKRILHESRNNARIFSKVWRNFPDGSAWIVPDGEFKGSLITGMAYDTRYDKAYIIRSKDYKKSNKKQDPDEKTFICIEDLPLHLLSSLLRCIESLDFAAAPAKNAVPEDIVSDPIDSNEEDLKDKPAPVEAEKQETEARTEQEPAEQPTEQPAEETAAQTQEETKEETASEETSGSGEESDGEEEEPRIEFTGHPIQPSEEVFG